MMGGIVIYTSHFIVLYGVFQWPLSIVFVTETTICNLCCTPLLRAAAE